MKKIIAVAVTFAVVAGLSSIATASIVGNRMRVCINPRTRALQWSGCQSHWKFVTWNIAGPRGPRGFDGTDGAQGPAGVTVISVAGGVARNFVEVGEKAMITFPCSNENHYAISYEFEMRGGDFTILRTEWRPADSSQPTPQSNWQLQVRLDKDTEEPGASFVARSVCALGTAS